MRTISKSPNFKPLNDWIKLSASTANKLYEDLPQDVKAKLVEKLLKEQFYLCAYSGVAITDATCHIEHIKPRTVCKMERETDPTVRDDVSYFNMVACFPKDGGDKSYGFGAPIKSGTWIEEKFVSPLTAGCERRFKYGWSGSMAGVEGDDAAIETVKQLGLSCDNIKKMRRSAIRSFFGFNEGQTPISKKEQEILLKKISQPKNGKLPEFVFVLKHLLERMVSP